MTSQPELLFLPEETYFIQDSGQNVEKIGRNWFIPDKTRMKYFAIIFSRIFQNSTRIKFRQGESFFQYLKFGLKLNIYRIAMTQISHLF